MFAVSGKRTMAGAKRFVFDEGINIAPRCKTARERLVEMSARWNERHPQAEKRHSIKAKVRSHRRLPISPTVRRDTETEAAISTMAGYGMPGWAREIVLRIATEHQVSPLDVVSRCRKYDVVPARNEAFYTLKVTSSPLTGVRPSYPQIAKWFDRDHTGILWGAAKYAHEHGLPAFSEFQYEQHAAKKRERHQHARSLHHKEC